MPFLMLLAPLASSLSLRRPHACPSDDSGCAPDNATPLPAVAPQTPLENSTMGRGAFGMAGETLFKFAGRHLTSEPVRPFMWGMLFSFVVFGGQSLSGNKEARAASKYLNPPKH